MTILEASTGAVVVGVDGSEAGDQALDWAAEQAALERRPLTIVHGGVVQMPPGAELDPALLLTAMRREGHAVLERAAQRARDEHDLSEVATELVMDDARAALLEASSVAHLLVVGSRGRGPVTSLLLGSVGIALSQHARCPVVVRRPHEPRPPGAEILVGTDLTENSEPALEWAFRQAALRGSPLTIIHTLFEGLPEGDIAPEVSGHAQEWARLQEIADRFAPRFPDVEVQLRLRRGLADEALTQAAASADMVVLGAHVRRSIFGLLDLNVPRGVLEHAPCLVAVVPAART
ncbi:universal stress protein [Nocardioides pantholopis]|uniref:universal stress protein n=1 Tax=Nocardioides pantholopis TaxID=2483798 RepID=UPI000FD7B74C|nr:universal stress protein [Nocardioides pantholopis]